MGQVYDKVEDLGFFAYHGSSAGDHFRKQGLGGWKLILSVSRYTILKKGPRGRWRGQYSIEADDDFNFDEKEVEEFLEKVERLVETGEIAE